VSLGTPRQTPASGGGLSISALSERFFLQIASWPALLLMLAVTAIPFAITIGLAFTNYDLVRSDSWRFVGLDNFEELLADRQTPIILLNTMYLVIATTVIPTVVGLGLAVLMERSFRGIGLIRTLYLVPIMTAPVVVALTWRAMFNNDAGWVNWIAGSVGLPTPVWLGDPLLAMPVVIITDAWTSIPFQSILLLAALLGVPRELKEAAAVDGASRLRQFWHVTLPWIRPVLFVVMVLRFLDAFRKFEGIQQLTGGGPGLSSTPINLQIYNTGLYYHRVGYAASWGIVMVLMIAASVGVIYLIQRRLR
jgi:multiple sugar transport system permease protein